MAESLYIIPESFDDETFHEAAVNSHDPDIVYIAGDISEDVLFKEDEAIAILANYGQVRNYLHKKTLGRGFFQPRAPTPGGKGGKKGGKGGKGGGIFNARPKQVTRRFLTDRSICARCGKTGHWARECKNEPDERGKRRLQGHTLLQTGTAGTGSSDPPPESLSTNGQSLSPHWHGEPPPTLISIESAIDSSPPLVEQDSTVVDSSFQFCFTTARPWSEGGGKRIHPRKSRGGHWRPTCRGWE
jgi:hypothetical protein